MKRWTLWFDVERGTEPPQVGEKNKPPGSRSGRRWGRPVDVVPLSAVEDARRQGAEEERERLRPVLDAARLWYAAEFRALPTYQVDDAARQLGEALAALDTPAPSEPEEEP